MATRISPKIQDNHIMNNAKNNLNKSIIALFSGQASTITTPKLYIQLTGSHALGSVLNQSVFWSNKSRRQDGSFYKTYKEWFEEINIPERTLRRYFDKLEQRGWIVTKVKKVDGKNIKHIKPDMDKLIESISIMLDIDSPNRPTWPDKKTSTKETCTKTTPTGQLGRLEPAKLAGSSIYTEDNIQKKLTNCEVSSSFFFSETLDKQMLNEKLYRDDRSDNEVLAEVFSHVENHMKSEENTLPERQRGALNLLKKLKSEDCIFHVKGKRSMENAQQIPNKEKTNSLFFTERQSGLVQKLRHAKRMEMWGASIEVFMPDSNERKEAEDLLAQIEAIES